MIPIKYFVSILLLIVLITSMIYCSKEESKPNNKKFTPAPAPSLTYAEQTIRFSSITGVTKTLAVAKILAGVRGSKEGYTIKSITLVSSNTTASAKVSGTTLTFTKIGNIVFNLVLKHASKEDATIKNCKIIISKDAAAILTFNRVSKAFVSGGNFTTSEILAGVAGTKSGYTLKEIKALAPSDVASVTGTKPNLSLTMTKIGSFTATIVLEHSTKGDATITGAEFKISSSAGERLTFGKLTKVYSSGGRFTTAEILGRVGGTKAGYTLREISSLTPIGVASVTGTKPNLSLSHAKAGNFTATLVLEHATKGDSTIDNASFEITKASAPKLTWIKQSKPYVSSGEISNAELLAGLNGTTAAKTGYTIKSVIISSANGTGARVSGSGTAAKIVGYTKVGILTLTLVFQHPAKVDVTLTGKKFEITKASASGLTWTKQSKPYVSGGEISNGELLAGLTGSSAAKTGYTIKSVIISSANGTGARVSGRGTSAKIVGYTKVGILTLTLVFEHPAKVDVTLTGKKFEITKASAPILTWIKQSKPYGLGGEISNAELLAGLNGTSAAKTGYTIKSVIITKTNGTGARVSGRGTSAKIVGYTKAGTLTLTLVFEHSAKVDVTLTGKEFEITKSRAESLTWRKQTKVYSSSGEITNAQLLAGVQGSKTGYTIKTVNITNHGGMTSARVAGSGRAAKITSYTKVGTFTLTIVLQHHTKEDAIIRNAQFEITKANAESLSWTKQQKHFSSGGEITNTELLRGVTGSGKNGYTIKTVTITNKNGTSATVSGSGRAAKITSYNKVGTLTLTLVLAHDTKKDVTLTGAKFEIYKIFDITSSGVVTLKSSVDKKSLTAVIIPNMIDGTNVTSIGNKTFKYCTSLTSITIPNSVTSIGNQAFNDCTSLTSITIPNSVTSIGIGAFQYCSSLTSITIPNSVTSIGMLAFQYCSSLTSITIPNSVTSIGQGAFSYCSKLTSITLSNKLTSISSETFRACTSLTSVTISNKVTSIRNQAFQYCSSLTSITMGNSVTSIGKWIFKDCSSLTTIKLPTSITTIRVEPFTGCSKLTTIQVPNAKVTDWQANLKIGNSASVVGY